MDNFYVYLHVRKDSNEVFYVGKGRGYRAYRYSGRNNLWNKIVKKCGYYVDFYAKDVSEDVAFEKEKEAIKLYRGMTKTFANFTDGGEGMSGYIVSEETRKKLRNRHFKMSEESKIKMSESHRGEKGYWYGKKLSQEHRKKLCEAWVGRVVSEDTKIKISIALRGKKKRPESKINYSRAVTGEKNRNFDATIFHFVHKEHGHEICTKHFLRKKYILESSGISKLTTGKLKTLKGWRMYET